MIDSGGTTSTATGWELQAEFVRSSSVVERRPDTYHITTLFSMVNHGVCSVRMLIGKLIAKDAADATCPGFCWQKINNN